MRAIILFLVKVKHHDNFLGFIIESSINFKEIIQQSFRQNLLWTSKSAHLVVCSINDTEIKLPWPTQDHINKKLATNVSNLNLALSGQ